MGLVSEASALAIESESACTSWSSLRALFRVPGEPGRGSPVMDDTCVAPLSPVTALAWGQAGAHMQPTSRAYLERGVMLLVTT